ncbi:MAG: 1-acyl-sn-glycerol-3-phosphate acyltransferase [Planctomycetes bacterium]|nr:1-acyl-sn-glycerol-3-phosphate acyltransferase [Planctomycetota bacterium]
MPVFRESVDYYTSRMHDAYGPVLRWLFRRYFGPVRTDSTQVARVKELAAKGTVVYCLRTRSTLDYLCSNWVYLREGLPLARFANGINLSLWQPLAAVVRTTLVKLGYYLRGKRLPDPRTSGYLESLCREGESSLVFLGRGTSLFDRLVERFWAPLWDPILALVEAQERTERPIYLVPQVLFFQRRPGTLGRTLADVLFGESLDPGRLRKMVAFLRGYRRASLVLAEPIDLAAFLAEHRGAGRERLARLIRLSLRNYLYREFRVTAGPVKKPRERTKEKILKALRADLAEIARRDGRPLPEVAGRAEKMLDEIAADTSPRWLEFLNGIFTWVWNTLFRRVHVLGTEIERVRAHLKRAPLVLVSSHKSHLDYLLISYIFYNHDITPPHIAAGVNLSFWPLGTIFRKGGAFFIRRTFGGSRLYPEVFKKYLRYMIREGYSIEFFIEGGRSRTGRLREPKYGLLGMIAESFLDGAADDLFLVPIAINYDRVPEDRSHAAELSGAPKNPESLAGLLSLSRTLTERYGRVYLRVGEIVSLADYASRRLPPGTDRSSPAWRPFLEELGLSISDRINRVTMVTPTSLVSAALLGSRDLPAGRRVLLARQERLLSALRWLGAPTAALLRAPDRAFEEATRLLARFGLVRSERRGEEILYAPAAEDRLALAYYKNTIVHHLRGLAEVSQALASLGSGEHLRPQVYQVFERLDRLYACEFVEPPGDSPRRRFELAISFLERSGVLLDRPGGRVELARTASADLALFAALLGDLAEGYGFVLDLLHVRGRAYALQPAGRAGPRDSIRGLLAAGRRAALSGALRRPEAVSSETFENAARAFQRMLPDDREGLRRLLKAAAGA